MINEVKIGVCSWSMWQSLPEQMNFLASQGFTSCSLLQHVMKCDPGEKREAAAVIKNNQLTLTFHSNVLAEHLIDQQIDRDYMKRLYDEVIWWHENTNGVYSSCSDANLKHVCMEHLAYMRERLSPYQIRFGLENTCWDSENKYFCHPAEMKEVIDSLIPPSHLCGTLIDAGHANVRCTKYGDSLDHYIASIPAPIWEVHITDNFGLKDDHLPLGDGSMDLGLFLTVLKKKGFNGVFTYESLRKQDRAGFDLRVPEDVDQLLQYKEKMLQAWRKA